MIEQLGVVCITIAILLEVAAYYRQIRKTLRTRKSSHVSSSALLLRLLKYIFTLIALGIYANWVGFLIQAVALICCAVTLRIVALYKPKGWKLL